MRSLLLISLAFTLLSGVGCVGSEKTTDWPNQREAAEDRIEDGLDAIEDELEAIASPGTTGDQAFYEARRIELENYRQELNTLMDSLETRTRETWAEFEPKVDETLEDLQAKLDDRPN